MGEKFGVTHTPTVFVNGAKFEGAVPMDFVFDMVDSALKAEGKVPPNRQHASEQMRRQANRPNRRASLSGPLRRLARVKPPTLARDDLYFSLWLESQGGLNGSTQHSAQTHIQ